jgi:drug/metabolite transporter (DMT)-like permease
VTRNRAEAALVANTIIWGATFVLVKEALAGVSTLLFLALRFSLASLALLVLFRRSWSNTRAVRQALAGGALTGVFLFAGYFLQTLGLRLTTAPKSAFLTGLSSVMVPLLALCVYRNRPRVAELAGLLVATCGMALMTIEVPLGAVNRGDALTFFCAVAFAAHIVALGHFSGEVSFELMSIVQIGTAAVLSLALCGWVETPVVHWRPQVIWAVLITGILATALAFTVMAWAQRYTTSTRTALIYMLEPVFAWITSYLLVGEGLSRRAAAGAALILGGVLLVELKPFESRQHPSV